MKRADPCEKFGQSLFYFFLSRRSLFLFGPNDMVYVGVNALYVGDGDFIWRISRAVPEPASVVLFGLGLIVMGFAGRAKRLNSMSV